MAKTSKRAVGPTAGVATAPRELAAAIRRPTLARKLELLREVGILDDKGKLAKKYRSWGTRVSRTTGA
jgi:hypothetical protein